MNIVFWGSPEFAVPSLNILAQKYNIIFVVTAPDRPCGRKLKITPPPLKTAAVNLGLNVFQPEDLTTDNTYQKLKIANADLFIVVSYGKILNKKILTIPKMFAINLHASILPKFRGAAPINWALLSGERKTGVTVIKMNEYMDRGESILTKEILIGDNDDVISLLGKLSRLGAETLVEAVDLLINGKAVFTKQNEEEATYAPSLKKSDGRIKWVKSSVEIINHIRAMAGWPTAYTFYKGKNLKIFKARILDDEIKDEKCLPGTVIAPFKIKQIIVKTGSGAVSLEEIQLQSSRRMRASEFLAGHHLSPGERFS
ncbi:MAG: methionyl-tRNA formyltransferase [Candidatus Omnitrophota bacterium]